MKKRKSAVCGLLTMCITMGLGTSVFAGEPETRATWDSYFKEDFIGYSTTQAHETPMRWKDNDSYHYVMNTSGFNLWVISYDRYYNNRTRGLRAIVPGGEWFITNSVFEDHGYVRDECRLNITSATSGVSGYLKGKWSPDSIGSYPVAN
ncbi:hypothetical protein [Mediterraneibacter agrestimuris]|uniref:hypothetical protein n=1 Tax=Mediterraneibacter agrestimuris TaxID=2941333 RepID=UPI00203B2174|nr:hypothetical protein [Mediterraneibacter agrestimuris]